MKLLALALLASFTLAGCGGPTDQQVVSDVEAACALLRGDGHDMDAMQAEARAAALSVESIKVDDNHPRSGDLATLAGYLADAAEEEDPGGAQAAFELAENRAKSFGATCQDSIDPKAVAAADLAEEKAAAAKRRAERRAATRRAERRAREKAAATARKQARDEAARSKPGYGMTPAEIMDACMVGTITDYDTCFKAGFRHGGDLAEEAMAEEAAEESGR